MKFWFALILVLTLCVAALGQMLEPEAVLRLEREYLGKEEFARELSKLSKTSGKDPVRKAVDEYLASMQAAGDRDRLVGSVRMAERKGSAALRPLTDPAESTQASTQASAIKKENFYADPAVGETSNWMGKALKDLREAWERLTERATPNVDGLQGFSLPTWIMPLVWAVLSGIVVGLLTWLGMYLYAHRGRVRKSEGLLAEGEELLPADEWLLRGEAELHKQNFAEAVRCFYLAMLVRLDETNHLEFRRHETNWEHYRRFKAQPSSPGAYGFNLRDWTLRFDYVWYGGRDHTQEQAQAFRAAYSELLSRLKERAA